MSTWQSGEVMRWQDCVVAMDLRLNHEAYRAIRFVAYGNEFVLFCFWAGRDTHRNVLGVFSSFCILNSEIIGILLIFFYKINLKLLNVSF